MEKRIKTKKRFENLEMGSEESTTQQRRLHVAEQLVDRVGLDKQQVREMAAEKLGHITIVAPPLALEKQKRELRSRMAAEEDRKQAERAAGRNPCPPWSAPDARPKRQREFANWFKRVFLRVQ
jgi:hypothetical protein